MEYINKVEIRGVVGIVNERIVGDGAIYRLSVCTETISKADNGTLAVDCTWHSVVYVSDSSSIGFSKGDIVHVFGSLRLRNYVSSRGFEMKVPEIVANKVIKEG